MDELLAKISTLKRELESKDEDLKLSANIGKELLEQSYELKKCIEKLKQDKHSLQMSLDMKIKIIENQTSEIEVQKDAFDTLTKDQECMKKENSVLNKKLQEKLGEVDELKNTVEELVQNNNSYQKKISSLEEELDNCKNSLQVSFNDASNEEYTKLMNQLQHCQTEKKSLLALTLELQHDLEETKLRESQLTDLIDGLRQAVQEKDQELQSYVSIIEKTKEENSELMGEIEFLKLAQVDVNQRGNSVFAEVEDRRKALEKQFIILRNKYDCLHENYEQRAGELQKVKHQLAIVLRMISAKVDCKYIEEVENRLCAAQKEIAFLTRCLNDQSKLQKDMAVTPAADYMSSAEDGYNYLRTLLQQSQKREEDLDKELQCVRVLKVAESDKLIQTQHLLYHTEKKAEDLKGEVLALKLKIQELTQPKPDESVPPRPNVEAIPGFKKEKDSSPLERVKTPKGQVKDNENDSESDASINFDKENKPVHFTPETEKPHMESNITKKQVLFCPADVIQSSNLAPKVRPSRLKRKTTRTVSAPTVDMAVNAGNCAQM